MTTRPCYYDYAVIRIVPRVEREEFINAGIILSCQASGFLAAAIALDEARLRALDPWADLALIRQHLESFPRICRGGPGSGPIGALPARGRFHWLTARRSALVQTSAVHTGRSADPADALQRLMARMVASPGAAPSAGDLAREAAGEAAGGAAGGSDGGAG